MHGPHRLRPTIVVGGALALRPRIAGHAWVFLNWLHGLQSIGFDVLFIDRLEPGMLDDPTAAVETSSQFRWLSGVMKLAGLNGQFAVLYDRGRSVVGMDRAELSRRTRGAVAMFNFMGYIDDDQVLGDVGRRIFVDIDPGFGQLWRAEGLHDPFLGHDVVATVGLAADHESSIVRQTGLPTVGTLPPVALDRWPVAADWALDGVPRVTSIATWRGPYAPVEHRGQLFGLRVHEFRRFMGLPRQLPGVDFELALDIDPADARDIGQLRDAGWGLVDPHKAVGRIDAYRSYIYGSTAEFSVAKSMYVRSRGGWFSDRSACYLAAGRPVVAQDTGWSAHLPTGEGLMRFDEPCEAEAALREVLVDLHRHSKAARLVAEDHFDARSVLPRLLRRVEVM